MQVGLVGASANTTRLQLAIVVICIVLLALIPIALKAQCQLALVPIIVSAFWFRQVFGVRIPKVVLIAAVAGTVLGATLQLSQGSLASGAFLVSTVSDKDLRQEAKIYRDRLKRSLRRDAESLIGVYPGVIRDAASARRALEQAPVLGGLIWGSSRWVSVTLRGYEPLELSSFPVGSVARDLLVSRGAFDLQILRSVPSIGMSHGHERGTVHFIGEVVKAWRRIPEVTKIGAASGEFEGELEALARTQARWSSRVHIALPLWLAGTVHLVRAIETESLQQGELLCALSKLREAIMQFRTHDNPALEMAVRNNYALALLTQAQYVTDGRKLEKKAHRQFAAAMRHRKHSKELGSVVALNYMSLMQARKRSVINDRKR